MQARTLYLHTGGSSLWNQANARFAVYAFNNGGNQWTDMSGSGTADIYKADIDDGYTTVIFCRMDGSTTENKWDNKWNQTEDLSLTAGKDMYVITGWGSGKDYGEWRVFGKSDDNGGNDDNGGDVVDSGKTYDTAVPAECEDVMLQCFYWDSYTNKGYGDTRWTTLIGQTEEIGKNFTLVWLPPSSESKGELGYIPSCYSTQSSISLGKRQDLQNLISSFHNNGVRVLADIVINHCGNRSSTCDFNSVDFGSFGKFSPTSAWMTSDDEGVTQYGCSGGGNADDGQNGKDKNYSPARDWDHKNSNVQAMFRAYLKWMKNEMKYDGFRFDYAGGYHTSHINDYVSAAKPYFSVMEYWNGDAGVLKSRIDDAGRNTFTFDFANMYTALRDGICKGTYTNCTGSGLRGKGYSRYAVTFVDNHDTFARGNDQPDVMGKRDGSSINDASLMMQCNAYILSLPGVPCVFYPHWIRYKSEIKKMIQARRAAGIHSESSMTETADKGSYEAVVNGKHGRVILYLGTSAAKPAPQGFTEAVKGNGYAMYYSTEITSLEQTEDSKDVLDLTMPLYNILGIQVDGSYKGIVIQNGKKYRL